MLWEPERHQRQVFSVRTQTRDRARMSMRPRHVATGAGHWQELMRKQETIPRGTHAPSRQLRSWTLATLAILLLVAFGVVALA